MIRILHVIGSLNNGGSQAMVMNLYRNIDRSKIQFDFIVDRSDELFFAEEIKALGGRIYFLPTFNIKNIPIYKKEWKNFFEKNREYKIIHGHVRSTASIYLGIAKKYGLKTIAHSHNNSSGKGIKALIKNVLQYPIRYIADYYFACSRNAGEWLYGKKVCKGDRFTIINNAIDSSKFIFKNATRQKVREKMNINEYFVIGNIGRFHHQKNHEFMINVFKAIHDKDKKTKLLLVGDGELLENIKKKVENLGLSKSVIFTGIRSDTNDLLNAMDLFIFPSIYEGLGIVAIEAQASGLQCVVSDAIQDEVFITNLVESISLKEPVELWAEKILSYKNNYQRYNRQSEIINSGFDIRKVTDQIQNLYFNIYEK